MTTAVATAVVAAMLFVGRAQPCRLLLTASWLLLLLVTGSHGFTCNVCLPRVVGSTNSKDLAMVIRTNITRLWPSISTSRMGECPDYEPTSKFMLECPTDDELTTCVKYTNGMWTGLSCGRITSDYGTGCYDFAGYTFCMCPTSLCNSPAAPAAQPITALLIAAIAVLMAVMAAIRG